MKHLTPDDERLIEQARGGLDPSGEDQARIKRKLFAQIGVVVAGTSAMGASANAAAGSAVAGGAGLAAQAGGIALGVKVVAVLAVVGAVGGGLGLVVNHSPSASAPAPLRRAAVAASPVPAVARPPLLSGRPTSALPAPPVVAGDPSAGSSRATSSPTADPEAVTPRSSGPKGTAAPADHVRSAGLDSPTVTDPVPSALAETSPAEPAMVPTPDALHVSAAPASPVGVADEADVLRRADLALKANDPRAALALLDEHALRFPRGVLIEERDAERVVVLCALARVDEARSLASAFLRANPRSPLAARVRASCAAP